MRLVLVLAIAALAGAAQAQPAEGMRQPPNPDLDRDGKVTLAEFKQMEAQGFLSRLDANKDGRITKAEFDAAMARAAAAGMGQGGRGAGLFAMLDANKDSVISKAERDAATTRRFNMADTNHDGWLSKGEVLMMRQQMRARAG